MILGYIVSDKKIKNIDGFVVQVDDISLADSTKPILIVGWKNAKKDPRYTSILDRQLEENVFWTFSKTESRIDFEEDLKIFYSHIYGHILDNIIYNNINIFKLKYTKIKKLFNIIKNKNIYLSNNLLYIPHEGGILGLSLSTLEYCKIPKEKIIKKVKELGGKIFEDNIGLTFRLSKQLGNKKYAMPYFISS